MSQYIALVDEKGVRREYRVPDFASLTVAQWREMRRPHDATGQDGLIEDLHRFSGVPKKHLRKLPPGEADKLIEALVKAQQEAEKRAAEVNGEDWRNPTTITHEGVTYTVPQDLERDTTFGQWVDLDAALQGSDNDAEIMADICAAMLVEDGKEYAGLTANLDRMQTLPVRVAMGLTAFFLLRSERLRSAIHQHSMRRVTSLLQGQGQEGSYSTTGTPSGTAS